MKFLIIYDPWKQEAIGLAGQIDEYMKSCGIDGKFHGGVIEKDLAFSRDPIIALVLGGDGFIVKNAMRLAKMRIPLVGINFGTLGFLAAIEPEVWQEEIEKIIAGQCKIKRKGILKGVYKSIDGRRKKFEAINEAAFFRGLQKFIRVRIEVDGFVVYEDAGGDGMMVVSAIGSTAYNLAAGGHAFEGGLGITPLAPQKVNVKPFVLEEGRKVRIICLGGSKVVPEEFSLEVDGRGIYGEPGHTTIKSGDEISVRYGKTKVQFIEPEGFFFIQALQRKLGLSR